MEDSWNHEYFGSLAKLTFWASHTLQETQDIHGFMNLPKI